MKVKVTVVHGTSERDVVLTADTAAKVSAIIERLAHQIAPKKKYKSLVVNPGTEHERVLLATETLGESGLRSGDRVQLSAMDGKRSGEVVAAATLHILAGPDAPGQYPLRVGTNLIGRERGCDVRLSDPMVSKRHARVNVTDMVQLIDEGSANGIIVGEQVVDRAVLRPGAVATLGETVVSVALTGGLAASADAGGSIGFNRSPRLDPQYVGVEVPAPEPPKPPQHRRFPIMSLVAPIMMAGMIYAVTRNPTSVLFVALSPLMMIGGWFEGRLGGSKDLATATEGFRENLVDLSVRLQLAADAERVGRRSEHPSATEIEEAMRDLSPLLWTRRAEHDSFLKVRLGLGSQASRNSVAMPNIGDSVPHLRQELLSVVEPFALVDRVPVVGDLRVVGNIGVAGPSVSAAPVTANLVLQLAALHSPADLVIGSVGGESAASFTWLRWLPHVGSEYSPLETPTHLASDPADANALVSAVEEVVEARTAAAESKDGTAPLPAIVIVVGDDAPIERARIVHLAERGPDAGVHLIWQAPSLERLPAACRAYVESDPSTHADRAAFIPEAVAVVDLEPEQIPLERAEFLARRLAPVVDVGTRADDQSDLPRSVSFLTIVGDELALRPDAVIESWKANNSLPPAEGAPAHKRNNTLRALVGHSSDGKMQLDLRSQGPHALVGGTTGAGKSEFLQSWVLGIAAMHSASRATFLFVDYKGGAAFADCVDLPHCVGLVTDLSPHLVRRALTSLNAELHHREVILHDKKAKDLFELEKRNDPDAPPSLIIVVDEFAALVSEVPEFVDGVVNVAQRGRSLGLHLILATQRPAGVIKDNLRANTNLRIALRMADEADSVDVVGTKLAATFDPSLPGRAVAKTGPGRLTSFQAAYAGGHTSHEPPEPDIEIRDLVFGRGSLWEVPEGPLSRPEEGPSDIARVVKNIARAHEMARVPTPRKPWLPELSSEYRIELLTGPRTDETLIFGVRDVPERQAQEEVAFVPDIDGNMVAYGGGGSGKSTFLRSIAFAASLAPVRGGPCHIYGIDFGSRGLHMLEVLPHVGSVISGDDNERVQRLLRTLRDLVDERSTRYAPANVSTIVEYRAKTGDRHEPRVVVLIDGVGAFKSAYEATSLNGYWELFLRLAAEGRSVGVHFVMSADRPASVSSSLASTIGKRLVLQMANELDYTMVQTRADGFTELSPPGRGFINGDEVQVAVLAGTPNVSIQADETAVLASDLKAQGFTSAAAIASLPAIIPADELPPSVESKPTLGVWDETLEPIAFEPSGSFLVTGPQLSGKTTAVVTMVRSLRKLEPSMMFARFAYKASALALEPCWKVDATGAAAIADKARELAEQVATMQPNTLTVVVEGIGDLLNSECDVVLQDLLRACRDSGQFVIADGETSTVGSGYPLLAAVRVSRAGLILQPDQLDGADNIFKTPLPKVSRAEFPPGRGMLIRSGKVQRVQVADPS